jgi:CSLREA domain-containing protein
MKPQMKIVSILGAVFVGLGLSVLVFWSLGRTPAVYAAVITVDTTDNARVDDNNCSLREAIAAANLDAAVDNCTPGSGHDLIQFAIALSRCDHVNLG